MTPPPCTSIQLLAQYGDINELQSEVNTSLVMRAKNTAVKRPSLPTYFMEI